MSGEAIVCGGRNWVSSIQFAMSGRDYRGYRTASKFRHGANSSKDPGVSSTRASNRMSSNARTHPKADAYKSYYSSRHNSHHDNHTQERSVDDRKRKTEESIDNDIWTEHMSSKGRIYYYNQRTEKSQWTRPTKGTIKRLKEDVLVRQDSTDQESSHTDLIKGHDREASGTDSTRKHDQGPTDDVDAIRRHSEVIVTKHCTSQNQSRSTSASSTPRKLSPLLICPPRSHLSSSSSVTPDVTSPTTKQRSTGSSDPKLQILPPEAQDLHPLQQALLLQQCAMIPPLYKETKITDEDDGSVSMELSSPSPPSSMSDAVNCPKRTLPTIPICHDSVGNIDGSKDTLLTATPQSSTECLSVSDSITPLMVPFGGSRETTDQSLSKSIKDSKQPCQESLSHGLGGSAKYNSLLSPSVSYNPIADLPMHLREPLPIPPIDAESFQPNLTEFWYTPANEMMEKQIHQSANEFMFKTVSMTRRLDFHLAKSYVTLQMASLSSDVQTSRLQSLKKILKEIEDTR